MFWFTPQGCSCSGQKSTANILHRDREGAVVGGGGGGRERGGGR